jgi:hypothetical protein
MPKSPEQMAQDLRCMAGRIRGASDHLIDASLLRDRDPFRDLERAELEIIAAIAGLKRTQARVVELMQAPENAKRLQK